MNSSFIDRHKAAMVIDELMRYLAQQGDAIDEHLFLPLSDSLDPSVSIHQHRFDWCDKDDKRITLYSRLYEVVDPMQAEIIFSTDLDTPTEADYLLYKVLAETRCHQMFYANGHELVLGNFFSRRSELRIELQHYIDNQLSFENMPHQIAQALWKIIQTYAGLSGLMEIWQEVFEEVVLYQMRLEDPFCLERADTVYTSEVISR